MDAGARPHVDHMVGGAHHVLVVLNHQHAVADVAQVLQGFDQAVVVALVQADAGLVEHIHHAGQARADLAGQADALRLTAAECLGAAVQAEVVQAHVVQKLQAQAHLADHLGRNLAARAKHGQGVEVGKALTQGGAADLVNGARLIAFADFDVARLDAQAAAIAVRAMLGAAQTRQVFAHQGRIGLAVAPLHVRDDALEGMLLGQFLALGCARINHVVEPDFFFARAMQNRLLHGWWQRVKALVDIKLVVLGQALQHREVIAVAPIPALDGAAGQAQGGEGHHALGVEKVLLAQAVAAGAGAHRRVEGKQAWFQLADGVTADRAGELGVE